MRKTFIISTLLLISIFSQAQLGLTGGINLASLRNGNTAFKWENTPKFGFQIGVFYDLTLSKKFKFQPKLLLLNESYKRLIPSEYDDNNEYKESTNSYSCFIPLIFSYKVPTKSAKSFLVDFGLFSSIGLWGNFDRTIGSIEKKDRLYRDNRGLIDFGLITGLGYETQLINYSLHLKYGVLDFGYDNDRSITLLFSIGYKFTDK